MSETSELMTTLQAAENAKTEQEMIEECRKNPQAFVAGQIAEALARAENERNAAISEDDDSLLEKTYAMEALLDRLIYEIDQLQRTYRFYITRGTGTSALRDHMMHLRGFALEARKILGKE